MIDPRPIALVGLRASGKSTLGKLLAERLVRTYVDLDHEVALEDAALRATTVLRAPGAVLLEEGEARFRDLESRALERVLARTEPLVIATGGGVVERGRNRLLLRTRATCLWLHVAAPELQRRLREDPTPRPPLLGVDAVEEVPDVLAQRTPLYLELDPEILACGTRPAEELLERALVLLGRHGSGAG